MRDGANRERGECGEIKPSMRAGETRPQPEIRQWHGFAQRRSDAEKIKDEKPAATA
jgi:hypothetical protein